MEQREEYLITLQFFSLMINRNTVWFTQLLCSVLISWILPCINICTTTVPEENVIHCWTALNTIKTAFNRGEREEYKLLKEIQTICFCTCQYYQFCCWHHFVCRHGTSFAHRWDLNNLGRHSREPKSSPQAELVRTDTWLEQTTQLHPPTFTA